MSDRYSDAKFLQDLRQDLERSCDSLDGHTLSRLNKIRHSALEQHACGRGRNLLAPFGGLVTACILVVVVSVVHQTQPVSPPEQQPASNLAIEDLEILTSGDSLEFYEDFEFYQWLAENDASV